MPTRPSPPSGTSPDRPSHRYRRPPGRGRKLLLGVLAAVAYSGAVALSVLTLRDLEGWGVLGAGALGLLVALLVVVGRSAVAALRPPEDPPPVPRGSKRSPGGRRHPQGGSRAGR